MHHSAVADIVIHANSVLSRTGISRIIAFSQGHNTVRGCSGAEESDGFFRSRFCGCGFSSSGLCGCGLERSLRCAREDIYRDGFAGNFHAVSRNDTADLYLAVSIEAACHHAIVNGAVCRCLTGDIDPHVGSGNEDLPLISNLCRIDICGCGSNRYLIFDGNFNLRNRSAINGDTARGLGRLFGLFRLYRGIKQGEHVIFICFALSDVVLEDPHAILEIFGAAACRNTDLIPQALSDHVAGQCGGFFIGDLVDLADDLITVDLNGKVFGEFFNIEDQASICISNIRLFIHNHEYIVTVYQIGMLADMGREVRCFGNFGNFGNFRLLRLMNDQSRQTGILSLTAMIDPGIGFHKGIVCALVLKRYLIIDIVGIAIGNIDIGNDKLNTGSVVHALNRHHLIFFGRCLNCAKVLVSKGSSLSNITLKIVGKQCLQRLHEYELGEAVNFKADGIVDHLIGAKDPHLVAVEVVNHEFLAVLKADLGSFQSDGDGLTGLGLPLSAVSILDGDIQRRNNGLAGLYIHTGGIGLAQLHRRILGQGTGNSNHNCLAGGSGEAFSNHNIGFLGLIHLDRNRDDRAVFNFRTGSAPAADIDRSVFVKLGCDHAIGNLDGGRVFAVDIDPLAVFIFDLPLIGNGAIQGRLRGQIDFAVLGDSNAFGRIDNIAVCIDDNGLRAIQLDAQIGSAEALIGDGIVLVFARAPTELVVFVQQGDRAVSQLV